MPDETVRILIQGDDRLSAPAGTASRALSRLSMATVSPTKALGALVDTLGRVGLAALGVRAVVSTVTSLATAITSSNAQFEQFEVSFTTLLGSADAARAKLEELEEFAKTTPFTLPGVVTAAQQMLAYGFAADELTDTLRAVSDATSTFGSDAMPRAIRALGQMRARGKVASQEMLQLTETGLPAWQMLAEQMGVTTGKLQDMVTKGLVPAETAIKGLIDGMKARFGGLSDAQSRTFNGMMSNLEDWWTQAKRTLAEPIFDQLKDNLRSLLDYLGSEEVQAGIEDLGTRIGVVIDKSITALGNLKDAWIEMSSTARLQIALVGVALVAGGPIVRGLGFTIKALATTAVAFRIFAASAIGRVASIGAAFLILSDLVGQVFYEAIGTVLLNVGKALNQVGVELRKLGGVWETMGRQIEAVGVRAFLLGIEMKESMGWGESRVVKPLIDQVIRLAEEAVPYAEDAFESLALEVESFANDQLAEFQRQIDLLTRTRTQTFLGIEGAEQGKRVLEEQIRLGGVAALTARQLMESLYGVGSAADAAVPPLDDEGDASRGGGEENEKAAQKARQLVLALGQIIDALVAQHPAMIAAAADIALWQSRIDAVNLALVANADQLRAATSEMSAMQAQLRNLNAALSEQQRILSDLTQPQLIGMRAMSEQIAAVERQLSRLRLAEIGLPSVEDIQKQYSGMVRTITEGGTEFTVFGISTEEAEAKLDEMRRGALAKIMAQFPEMTDDMRDYLSTLPMTEDGLAAILEQLRLTESLKFDEALQRIREEAEGIPPEMSFDQVIAGIQAAKANITALTAEIGVQESAIAVLQGTIDSLRDTADALNKTLATFQQQLQDSEMRQRLINGALADAYRWYIEDRQKVTELGDEGVRVAGLMDVKTQALLRSIQLAATDTTGISTQALQAMVTQYQIDMALAVASVNGVGEAVRAIPTSWTTVHRIETEVVPPPPNAAPIDVNQYWTEPGFEETQGGVIQGMQHGGSWTVRGPGGTDSQLVMFKATPGERVTVTPPSGSRSTEIDYDRLAAALARAMGRQQPRNINQTIVTNQRVDAGQSYLSLKAAVGV